MSGGNMRAANAKISSGPICVLPVWADAAASRQSLEQEYIRYARVKEIYDQIRVLDADGNELVRMWGSESAKRDAYGWGFCTRLNLMCSLPGALGKITITPTGS